MPFPANQVIDVFMLLLIAICLAVIHVIASHQEHLRHHFGLSGTVFPATYVCCVPQQLNSRQNGEFCGHRVESSLGSLMLSSVDSTIITNMVINQTGSYYIITNFYLIWDRSPLLRLYHCYYTRSRPHLSLM